MNKKSYVTVGHRKVTTHLGPMPVSIRVLLRQGCFLKPARIETMATGPLSVS
jgi:hypothetical protein